MNYSKGILGSFLYDVANRNFRTLRLASMAIDHLIMCGVILIPYLILMFVGAKQSNDVQEFLWPVILFIYMNKDVILGRSLAKRINGYKVVKLGKMEAATSLQCYLRNIVIPILWPLEVIITYFNPNRRLGDFIAGTEVISVEKKSVKSIFIDLSNLQVSLQLIWIVIAGLVYSYLLSYII